MSKINLAFAGCGFLGLYQTGVVAAFSQHGQGFLKDVERVSGTSAGSLHAAMLVCRIPIDQCVSVGLRIANKIRPNLYKMPWQNLDAEVREGLDGMLMEDAHKVATDRLHVSITCLQSPLTIENKIISRFDTRDELIDVLAQSCYIPFYSGFSFPKTEESWVIDGSYTDNLPIFEGYTNIKVSPFAGTESDVAPPEDNETAMQLVYKNMPFAVTSTNLKRIARVIVPPTNDGLKSLYLAGYRDGKHFLKKNGTFHSAPSPDILHLFGGSETESDNDI